MTQSGTATSDGAAREVKVDVPPEVHEAKRTARRIERNARNLVRDLAHLTELLPELGISVTFEGTLGTEGPQTANERSAHSE